MLKGRKIVLAITGSIAAYKSALLTRLLVKQGAEVRVIMTYSAKQFISPLTFATLSKNKVLTDIIANEESGEWNNHVELGLWADAFIIAPASANTLAKMANGQCDNLLLATYLSAKCPVFFAPAMDLDMWKHPSTQANCERLLAFGNKLISPEYGELASGLVGDGRMAEPEHILSEIENFFLKKKVLAKKKVLINAGPTYEKIDPVRFIGNHSSGKMGIALAETALNLGADVTLVIGPSAEKCNPSIKRIDVTSAEEMFSACRKAFKTADIAILSAAVADYKPAKTAKQKIKKSAQDLTIDLIPTTDILFELGKLKRSNQLLVGFALETENELENAKSKLKRKKLDAIVLNSLNDSGAGFAKSTNRVTLIGKGNKMRKFELKTKIDVAKDIFDFILEKK